MHKIVAFNLTIISLLSLILGENQLPTNYEYYTEGDIKSGLLVDKPYFTLNGKNITIYSGAMHYFRIPRAYWRNGLRKLRASGLNTVETYVAWNLHEYQSGQYDFGNGSSDMTDFLHIEEYLRLAQEEDLFVILRAGPYIASEFEFGSFPSWILREKDNISVRTSNPAYMKYVSRWFNVLIPIVAKYQFTKGGSIIAFQAENEYAFYTTNDKVYLKELYNLMRNNGIVELLVTSDNPPLKDKGSIKDLFFMTGNFGSNAEWNLNQLRSSQPGKPLMCMEYWTGGSDYWGQSHDKSRKTVQVFAQTYEDLLKYSASVNIYMFNGGTSFGFLSGGRSSNSDIYNSGYNSKVNNYDFGGCLTEAGDYSDKYYVVKDLVAKYKPMNTKNPEMPKLIPRIAYPNITINHVINLEDLLDDLPMEQSENVINMESLNINNGSGQSYGYIIYRKTGINLEPNATLKIVGRVCDSVIVLVNGKRVSPILKTTADLDHFGTWRVLNSTLRLTELELKNATIDLIVENWGRVFYALFKQYKGLWQGGVEIDGIPLRDWKIYPLEFKTTWTNSLKWKNLTPSENNSDAPKLFKANLEVSDISRDSYVYMENWTNGLVIINGFVLGNYKYMGPAQSLYLPGAMLRKGWNDLVVFEHFEPSDHIAFVTNPVYTLH